MKKHNSFCLKYIIGKWVIRGIDSITTYDWTQVSNLWDLISFISSFSIPISIRRLSMLSFNFLFHWGAYSPTACTFPLVRESLSSIRQFLAVKLANAKALQSIRLCDLDKDNLVVRRLPVYMRDLLLVVLVCLTNQCHRTPQLVFSCMTDSHCSCHQCHHRPHCRYCR